MEELQLAAALLTTMLAHLMSRWITGTKKKRKGNECFANDLCCKFSGKVCMTDRRRSILHCNTDWALIMISAPARYSD